MEPPAGKTPISINRLGKMTARLRIIVAALASLLAAGMPAIAQDSGQVASPPARNDLVGPPQLSDFSLNGTVTRQAPARNQPARQPPAQQRPATSAAQPAQRPVPARTATVEHSPATPRQSAEPRTPPQAGIEAPAPDETITSLPPVNAPANLGPVATDASPPAPPQRLPILPWIVAALVAAAAAVWFFFFRNRPRESYAGISSFDLQEPLAPESEPSVQPRAAPPGEPKPAQPAPPTGIVSTRLRPWLEIEFKPDRAVVDDNRAAVAFEISVVNSGNVPARDVLIEASLFNAGPMQAQQIQLFFDNPVARGDRIPAIPPMQRIDVDTAVFMARDQVQPIEIEGRPLFVPMIAFNLLYRWSGGEGQTSASYLVGKETKGDKLAPFRLDLGPRIFRGLDAREHDLKVRK